MSNENKIDDVLEIVQFLKDNAVTKKEFNQGLAGLELRFETRFSSMETKFEERLTETKSEIMTHIDGFIAFNQKLDHELTALRGKYNRLEEIVNKIAQHLQLDLAKL